MEIVIQKDAREASITAGKEVAKLLRKKPDAVIGFATGATPLLLYRELIRLHEEEDLDFGRVTAFLLDEYLGLESGHASSFETFMRDNLFSRINISAKRIHVPRGCTKNHLKLCQAYEDTIIKVGGIDLQILGIGTDGHIGFNEPISSFASRTRLKTLAEQTRKDNASFFKDLEEVPMHVVTMGIGTILDARRCLLLAFGQKKSKIIAQTVEGPVTAEVPATALHFHRHVTAFIDQAAASKLKHKNYYQYVYENKPPD